MGRVARGGGGRKAIGSARPFERCILASLCLALLGGCAVPARGPSAVRSRAAAERTFAGKYRAFARASEERGALLRARYTWRVVCALDPSDAEARDRARVLDARIREEAARHFREGVDRHRKKAFREARREFRIALAYDPEHKGARDYLEERLAGPDHLLYETREGDTPRRIAREVYGDADREFLVARFGGSGDGGSLPPGSVLRLPVVDPGLAAGPAVADGRLGEARTLFRAQQYPRAASLAEKILKGDPANGEAADLRAGSYYQMGLMSLRRKDYEGALRMLGRAGDGYRDVKSVVRSIRKTLQEAESHYANGVRLFLAEKLDEAVREWEKALALYPDHAGAKRDLAKSRRLRERLEAFQ